MMVKNYCVLLLLIILCSCKNNQQKDFTKNDLVNNEAVLDSIEQFFDNQNYLMTNSKDSTYIYFTRLGKKSYFTHSYQMSNGDSTNLKTDTIQLNSENKLQWNWQKKGLTLQDINSKRMVWQYQKDIITFEKKTNNTIALVSNSKEYVLEKTIPISLFLIRYNYDFFHKTHFAFDKANYTKKR